MARIRTVKPEFFRHFDLYQAERETGFPMRVAFAGLWTAADREGRFKWQPAALKLDCLPYDELDFSRVLDALSTRGWIEKYTSNGREYGWIPTFKSHQVINNRESASVLPDPLDSTTSTREPRVIDASPTRHDLAQGEGKGKEGKGREVCAKSFDTLRGEETEDSTHPPTRAPEEFSLSEKMRVWAKKKCPSVKLETETEKFLLYCKSKNIAFSDWPAGWGKWMLDQEQWNKAHPPGKNGNGKKDTIGLSVTSQDDNPAHWSAQTWDLFEQVNGREARLELETKILGATK